MSESIKRKSSSRQLLQNLISLTAQRSQEDAEEVERERRRRARETQRGEGSTSWPEPPQQSERTQNTELDGELKPRCCLVLEEDEGFSDWSHRLENRPEQDDCRARVQKPSTQQRKPETGEEKQHQTGEEKQHETGEEKQHQTGEEKQHQTGEEKQHETGEEKQHKSDKKKQQGSEEKEGCEPGHSSRSQETSARPPEKMSSNRKEVRTSYSSTVFLPQDNRSQHATGQPADRTSYLAAGTMKPRGGACRVDGELEQEEQKEEAQAALQMEQRSAETRQNPRDEDDQEEEELRFTHEEKEDLHHSWEEGPKEEEEEEEDLHDSREHRRREAEEEYKLPDKRSMESGRIEELNRGSAASLCSSSEGKEPLNYGPMSPTFKKLLIQFYPDEANSRVPPDSKCKIIERTESLRKSTGSIKKTLSPVAVSKIDKKLELYTHALEVASKEGRSGSQVLTDLTSPTEAVSSKKNLFEAGEAWKQNTTSVTPSKDADGLKVGVANLINQWVKEGEDGSRCSSPFRQGESSTGKRSKFLVMGHGKYEKVPVDSNSEDANCQSGKTTSIYVGLLLCL
ncbi:non-muscle caldesmon-like isoform X1 [Pseudochaenichthys georgianus]|uniref:non-muscle caldesmon-like isoform X1 n=1 Tax=Pseudochaenichthys georgianus TaxID=52239 RepID=UPI00146D9271|nr:lymphocyte-specific protein 1-like isoform X1 [Pseudochaenichthys georgianus]